MKRLLSLAAIFLTMASTVLAQDYEWKTIKGSMTEVPDNFYEGTTLADAVAYAVDNWNDELIVYGAKPAAGGEFTVYYYDYLEDGWMESTMTWEDIVDEYGGLASYPATKSSEPTVLNLDENSTDDITEAFSSGDKFDQVTLTRSMARFLPDGVTKRWHTVAFPFAMSSDQITANFGANARVMRFDGVDDNVFTFVSESEIEEEELYLVQLGDLDADVSQIQLSNVTMSSFLGSYWGFDYQVIPTYSAFTLMPGVDCTYYVISRNNLVSVDSDVQATATKFYIESYVDNDVKRQVFISLDGEETGIQQLNQSKSQNTKVLQSNQIVINRGDKRYSIAGMEIK